MKTAISIPDKVFEAAERTARRLGVSRSELYVNAIRDYLERHSDEQVTDQLNEVYSDSRADGELDPALLKTQSRSIGRADW